MLYANTIKHTAICKKKKARSKGKGPKKGPKGDKSTQKMW